VSGVVSWVVLATAVLTFATALFGFLATRKRLSVMQVQVDGNLTRVMDKLGISQDRSALLSKTLREAGVAVPEAGHDVPPLPGAPPGS
jgi:hypothetical protein